MSSNDELRRLKRLIVVSWFIFLVITLAAVVWGSIQLKTVERSFQLVSCDTPAVVRAIDGRDGKDGAAGLQGAPGLPGLPGQAGSNGANATPEQVAAAVGMYLLLNPPPALPGPQGAAGDDGRNIEVTVDPGTCALKSRYTGDAFWQVIAQLPVPCGVQP